MRRLDGDALADQHLQPAGGAMEGVAFGHTRSLGPVARTTELPWRTE